MTSTGKLLTPPGCDQGWCDQYWDYWPPWEHWLKYANNRNRLSNCRPRPRPWTGTMVSPVASVHQWSHSIIRWRGQIGDTTTVLLTTATMEQVGVSIKSTMGKFQGVQVVSRYQWLCSWCSAVWACDLTWSITRTRPLRWTLWRGPGLWVTRLMGAVITLPGCHACVTRHTSHSVTPRVMEAASWWPM